MQTTYPRHPTLISSSIDFIRSICQQTYPGTTHACSCEKGSIGLGFEDEVYAFGFAAGEGHFLRLLAVGLVVSGDCILARGQIGKLEATIFCGNGIVGVLQHRESAVHPWMNVTLHGDEFHLVVLVDYGRCSRGLRFVPLAVDLGEWVDVMRGLIFVQNLEFLVHLKRENMRQIAAAFLR